MPDAEGVIRVNAVAGALDTSLSTEGTTVSSPALEDLPEIDGSEPEFARIALLEEDPETGRVLSYEILHVTAHDADATTATVRRGREGTLPLSWDEGSHWRHVDTVDTETWLDTQYAKGEVTGDWADYDDDGYGSLDQGPRTEFLTGPNGVAEITLYAQGRVTEDASDQIGYVSYRITRIDDDEVVVPPSDLRAILFPFTRATSGTFVWAEDHRSAYVGLAANTRYELEMVYRYDDGGSDAGQLEVRNQRIMVSAVATPLRPSFVDGADIGNRAGLAVVGDAEPYLTGIVGDIHPVHRQPFPEGGPMNIETRSWLAVAGDADPFVTGIVGEPDFTLKDPFPQQSPTDYSNQEWLIVVGDDSPYIEGDIPED